MLRVGFLLMNAKIYTPAGMSLVISRGDSLGITGWDVLTRRPILGACLGNQEILSRDVMMSVCCCSMRKGSVHNVSTGRSVLEMLVLHYATCCSWYACKCGLDCQSSLPQQQPAVGGGVLVWSPLHVKDALCITCLAVCKAFCLPPLVIVPCSNCAWALQMSGIALQLWLVRAV